jgi:hypothetical protein
MQGHKRQERPNNSKRRQTGVAVAWRPPTTLETTAHAPVETEEILATTRTLLTVEPMNIDTHELGCKIARRYQKSVYLASGIWQASLMMGNLWTDGKIEAGQKRK